MPINLPTILTCAAIAMLLQMGSSSALAQPVTGVWQGVMVKQKGLQQRRTLLEIKLIARGDSILGTAYYFRNEREYIRYALRGYFGSVENTVHWQDMAMIENTMSPDLMLDWYREGLKAYAGFSCPDGKQPLLDGIASLPDGEQLKLKLAKGNKALFEDEWMPIIDDYFTGGNQPKLIDSLYLAQVKPKKPIQSEKVGLAKNPPVMTEEETDNPQREAIASKPPEPQPSKPKPESTVKTDVVVAKPKVSQPATQQPKAAMPKVATNAKVENPQHPTVAVTASAVPAGTGLDTLKEVTVISNPQVNMTGADFKADRQKSVSTGPGSKNDAILNSDTSILVAYKQRTKEIQTEIEVSGDSIELRFYDNAEVDGDSISLFLDGQMLFQHVKLQASPYVYKLSTDRLSDISELTMVAENLGAIPPNTAFMEAFTNGTRYTARLVSTESSSGVIRLVRKRE